jgi:hypothetical protein
LELCELNFKACRSLSLTKDFPLFTWQLGGQSAIFIKQMKKILAAILLLVYFTVSTGFVVSLHYCMDRLASTEIGHGNSDKCEYCGMQKDGNCCRDDVKIVKLQTIHLASKAIEPAFSLPVPLITVAEYLAAPFFNFTQTERAIAHGPPLSEQDTYLQNRVFRI